MQIEREQRRILYGLKRLFGRRVTLTKKLTPTVAAKTGLQSFTSETPFVIRRAILGPAEWNRSFAYDLAYIAAQRNFTYGGFFDRAEMAVIVDARDVAAFGEIKTDDTFVWASETYKVSNVREGVAFIMFTVTRLSKTGA